MLGNHHQTLSVDWYCCWMKDYISFLPSSWSYLPIFACVVCLFNVISTAHIICLNNSAAVIGALLWACKYVRLCAYILFFLTKETNKSWQLGKLVQTPWKRRDCLFGVRPHTDKSWRMEENGTRHRTRRETLTLLAGPLLLTWVLSVHHPWGTNALWVLSCVWGQEPSSSNDQLYDCDLADECHFPEMLLVVCDHWWMAAVWSSLCHKHRLKKRVSPESGLICMIELCNSP